MPVKFVKVRDTNCHNTKTYEVFTKIVTNTL